MTILVCKYCFFFAKMSLSQYIVAKMDNVANCNKKMCKISKL